MTRFRRSTALHSFTLIELLVVIAIIALLAAILLPALRKSIKVAREVVCMNNIHQLCVAATTYKEDYYGDYPPPVVYLGPGATEWRAHPHDLKASDIGFIAPYIGEDPNRFHDLTPLQEPQVPGTLRCPFGNIEFATLRPEWAFKNVNKQSVTTQYHTGYAYWGRLEWTLPGYSSHTSVPAPFKRKYASRNCDPDAALWGDSVSQQLWDGKPQGAYTHTYSGRPKIMWNRYEDRGDPAVPNSAFPNFDRQNMGRADGSVIIRWPSDVNPVPTNAGLTGWGSYHWWYY